MPLPQPTKPLTQPRVLIGEGWDEVNFFAALVAGLNLTDIQVEEYGGKSNLSKYLKEFQVRPGHQSVIALGITGDADGGVVQAFQSVSTLLTNNNLPAPAAAGQIAAGPAAGRGVPPAR